MSDKVPLLAISEPTELLALWRLVSEAKFQPDPEDKDLWGSPFVHALSVKVAAALLEGYVRAGDFAAIEAHKCWLASLPNNVVLQVVRTRLREDAQTRMWAALSRAEKREYVRGCIAPFLVEPEFLEGLIVEAEA